MKCYKIIFDVLQDLEKFDSEGEPNLSMQRLKNQTYELVLSSDDPLFHQALYDWYISRGHQERLLEVSSFKADMLIRSKPHIYKDTSSGKRLTLYSRLIFFGNSMLRMEIIMKRHGYSMNSRIQIFPFPWRNGLNIYLAREVCVQFVWSLVYGPHLMNKLL
jgi:Non-repetitive/WGA-negative nucleoporin C-terminal